MIVKFAKNKLDNIHSSFLTILLLGGEVLSISIPCVFLCANFFLGKACPTQVEHQSMGLFSPYIRFSLRKM